MTENQNPETPVVVQQNGVIGDLLPEEMQRLSELRLQSDQIVRQLGLNCLAEQRLLQQLQQMERMAQMALHQAGARLGIPDGTAWQVTDGGKVVLATPPPEAVAPVPQPQE